MASLAELRDEFPDLYQDMSDADMVYTLAQGMGRSPVRVAHDMGLDPSGYVQNQSTGEDFGTSFELGGRQTLRGLANLPNVASGLITGENLYETPGMDNEIRRLEGTFSPGYQETQKEIGNAWDEGRYGDYALGLATNPSYTGNQIAQSAPSMVGGGLFGAGVRGVTALGALGRGAVAAGVGRAAPYLGEGAVMTGTSYKNLLDADVDPREAAAYSLGIGAGGAAVAGAGGALANRAGVVDPERLFTGMGRKVGDDVVPMSYPAQIGVGMGLEAGEEALQSPWEQSMSNVAQEQPWDKGLARSAIEGGLVGGILGGGFNALTPPLRRITPDMPTDLLQDDQAPPPPGGTPPPPGGTPPPPGAPGDVYDVKQARPGLPDGMPYQDYDDLKLRAEAVQQQGPLWIPVPNRQQFAGNPSYHLADDGNLVGVLNPDTNQWVGTPPPGAAPPPPNATRAAEQAQQVVERQYLKDGWTKTPEKIALLEAGNAPKTKAGIYGKDSRAFVDDVLVMDKAQATTKLDDLQSKSSPTAIWKGAVVTAHIKNLEQQESDILAQQAQQNATIDGPGVDVPTSQVTPNAQPTEGAIAPTPTTSSVAQDAAAAPHPAVDHRNRIFRSSVAPGIGNTSAAPAAPSGVDVSGMGTVADISNATLNRYTELVSELPWSKPTNRVRARAPEDVPVIAGILARAFRDYTVSMAESRGKGAAGAGLRPVAEALAKQLTEAKLLVNAQGEPVSVSHVWVANQLQRLAPKIAADPQLQAANAQRLKIATQAARDNEGVQAEKRAQVLAQTSALDAETADAFTNVKSYNDGSDAPNTAPSIDFAGEVGRVLEVTDSVPETGASVSHGTDTEAITDMWAKHRKLSPAEAKAELKTLPVSALQAITMAVEADAFERQQIDKANTYDPDDPPKLTIHKTNKAGKKTTKKVTVTPVEFKARTAEREKALAERSARADAKIAELLDLALTLEPDPEPVAPAPPAVEKLSYGLAGKAWSAMRAMASDSNQPELGDLPEAARAKWVEMVDVIRRRPEPEWFSLFQQAFTHLTEILDNAHRLQAARGTTRAQPAAAGEPGVGGLPATESVEPDGVDPTGDVSPAGPTTADRNTKLAQIAARKAAAKAAQKDAKIAAWKATWKSNQADDSGAQNAEPDSTTRQGQAAAAENPTTEGVLRAEIKRLLGTDRHWRLHLYANVDEAIAAGHAPRKIGDAYGWVDTNDKGVKEAFFIVDRIEAGTELASFLHEVGAHIGMSNLIPPKLYQNLVNQLRKWAAQEGNAQETVLAKAALERIAYAQAARTQAGHGTMSQAEQDDELVAYFLEEAVKAGLDPTAIKAQTALGRWFRTLWATFKIALRKLRMQNIESLTGQNVVDLAYGAARLDINTKWHGTVNTFRRFDSKFMSAGAGGQWYSWGHYVGNRKGTGKYYMEMLVRNKTKPEEVMFDGKPGISGAPAEYREIAAAVVDKHSKNNPGKPVGHSVISVGRRLRAEIRYHESGNFEYGETRETVDDWKAQVKWLETNAAKFTVSSGKPEGQLFLVDVDAQADEIMHWDLPFNEQPERIQNILKAAMVNGKLPVPGARSSNIEITEDTTGKQIAQRLLAVLQGWGEKRANQVTGDQYSSDEGKAASLYLDSLGIKGMEHFDERSRKLLSAWKGAQRILQNNGSITLDPSKVTLTDKRGRTVAVGPNDKEALMARMMVIRRGTVKQALDQWLAAAPPTPDTSTVFRDSVAVVLQSWLDAGVKVTVGAKPDNLTTNLVVYNDKNIHRVARAPEGNTAPENIRYGIAGPKASAVKSHIEAGKEGVLNVMSDTYTGSKRGLLGWLGINQMVERYGDTLPVLKSIDKTFRAMSHQAKTWLDRSEQIDRLWSMLTPKQLELANDIAGNASLLRFDPSKDKADTPEKQAVAQKWQALKALDAANPKAKGTTVVLAAVQHFRDVMTESLKYLDTVKQAAIAAGASTHAIESLENTIKALKKRQTYFYLPLHRFGDFYSVAMSPALFNLAQRRKQHLADVANHVANPAVWGTPDEKLYRQMRKDPTHYENRGFESERAARRHAEKLKAKGWHATSNVQKFTSDLARAHLKPELAAFDRMLADTKVDAKVAAKLRDSYTDLLIEALPDGHELKHQLDREGIAGWDADMRRAFAKTAQSQAFAASRLLHARQLSEQIDQLGRAGDSFEPHAELARGLFNELKLQQELASTRSEDPFLVRFATGFNYMSLLGASPFFWALQLAQVPTITFPYLVGRNKSNVADTFRKLTSAWKQATQYITWKVEANEWRAELDFSRAIPNVSQDELQALKDMDDAGRFVFTIGQDLGAAAEGRNTKTARLIRSLNTPTHATELINRVSTGLAAYRISQKNKAGLTQRQGETASDFAKRVHDAAVEFSLHAVDNTQVNMDPVMGARNLKTVFGSGGTLSRSAARIIFQFWKFQQGMAYTTLTTMKDAWMHPDPELRQQARSTAVGLTLSLMLTSGAFGLPFVGTGMMLLSLVFGLDGDDDEDDNAERATKNWLAEHLPKPVADAMNRGIIWGLLPTDAAPFASPRFSMGTLMNPLGYARFDDAERGEDVIKELMFRTLGGPTGSSAAALWDGVQAAMDGNFAKATEKAAPLKLARDLARTYQLATTGVSTGAGETRIDPESLSAMSWVWQAMGATPMKKGLYHEGQAAVQGLKQAVSGEREKLLAKHAQTRLKGEDVSHITQDIMRFNQRHPEVRIKAENLRQAHNRRRDNQRKLTDTGVLADKQNRPYLGNAVWAQ